MIDWRYGNENKSTRTSLNKKTQHGGSVLLFLAYNSRTVFFYCFKLFKCQQDRCKYTWLALYRRNLYLLFFNSIEINKRSNKVYCIISRLRHFQTSLNSHVCINSPYVQTTKGNKSPPKKFQTSALLLAMLVQTLIRGNTIPR